MIRKTWTTVLLLALAASSRAAPIFSVSFDKGLTAEVAGGKKKPNVGGKLNLVPGKFGKAVHTGKAAQYLLYPFRGNLKPAKGTVSMWVKPVGFAPPAIPDVKSEAFDLFRMTPRTGGDEIRLMLSRTNAPDNKRCYLFIQTAPVQPNGIGGGGNRIRAWGQLTAHPGKVVVPWNEGEFKHVAATWDFAAGRIEVYLDGKRLKATTDDLLKKKMNADLPPNFQVGPYKGVLWRKEKIAEAGTLVLDEFKIFDRRLTPGEIATLAGLDPAGAYDRRKDYRPPLVTIPATTQPPAIDGRLSEGEWDAAAGVAGFLNLGVTGRDAGYLAPEDTRVKLTRDGAALYAVFISPIDKPPPPYTGAGDHYDAKMEMIEWWLAPNGKDGDIFQFIGAANGATYDGRNNDKRWNAKWTFRNGYAGGRWIAEIRVAFSDLGVDPPKPGDEWLMNFGRFYAGEGRATSWSDTLQRYNLPARFGRTRFGNEAVAMMTDVSEMLLGNIGWDAHVGNASDAAMHVELDLQGRLKPIYQVEGGARDGLTEGALGNLFLQIHPIKLAAGERRTLTMADAYQKRGVRFYSIAAMRLPERTRVFEQLIPISPAAGRMLFLKAAALYDARKIIVDIESGPLRAQIRGALKISALLKRNGDDVAAAEVPLTADDLRIALEPKPWQAGDFTVVVIATAAGREVARVQQPLQVRPHPVWWDNKIGLRDAVQPPWTPVRVNRTTVSVWGRDYQLGSAGLPTQVTTQDAPVLAGPVALRLGRNGSAITNAVLSERARKDARVIYDMKGDLGPYRITGNVEAMYDGVIEYDYTLTPRGGAGPIKGLWIEIPVRRDIAKYLVRRASGQSLVHGVTFRVEKHLTLPFNPSLWLGDVDHGLNWYTDTGEGWTAPRERTVQLEVLPDRAVLRLHVLAAGRATPVRLRFGLLATPFRPLRKGWRTLRLSGNTRWWTYGNYCLYDTAKLALFGRSPLDKKPNGEYIVPAKDRQWLDDRIREAHENDAKFVLYSPSHGLAERGNHDIYKTYHTEWDMLPIISYNGAARRFIQVCPRSRHQDFFIWNLDRMIKAGKLDAVYFDQGVADRCKNALHGCGYRQGAATRTTQTMRAQREFYRRVRQVFIDNGLEPMLIGHTSTQVLPANYTHLDAGLNGEQFTSALVDDDYIDVIDEPMLRTQWSSKLMGIPIIFLPETMWAEMKRNRWSSVDLFEKHLAGPRGLRSTRNAMALLLPNDVIFYGGLTNIEFSQRIWKIWDTLGDARHVSHRDRRLAVTPGSDTVHAGLYIRPDGTALLAVGNLAPDRAAVTVKIDADLLPLNALSARDPVDSEPVTLKAQTLTLDVGAKDFRLVSLSR